MPAEAQQDNVVNEHSENAESRVDVGPFSVVLPDGWTYSNAQGMDSIVGSFEHGVTRLQFDFGVFGGPLAAEGDSQYTMMQEAIDGYDAEIAIQAVADSSRIHVYIDRRPDASLNLYASK